MERCLNCDAPLTGPYCAQCGQHRVRPNPSFGELVHEAVHELTHLDSRLIKTFRVLLLEPGRLTVDTLAGRRARWLGPLRLYLICSVAYFASGPVTDRLAGIGPKEYVKITDSAGAVTRGRLGGDARAELERLGAKEVLGEARFNKIVDDTNALNTYIQSAIVDAIPRAMFVLMPLFALLTWLAWRDRGLRYPAHLYLALHLHAAWFASLTVLQWAEVTRSDVMQAIVGIAVLLYSTWYAGAALKRVLTSAGVELFVRTTIIGIVYTIWTFVAVLVAVAYAILTY